MKNDLFELHIKGMMPRYSEADGCWYIWFHKPKQEAQPKKRTLCFFRALHAPLINIFWTIHQHHFVDCIDDVTTIREIVFAFLLHSTQDICSVWEFNKKCHVHSRMVLSALVQKELRRTRLRLQPSSRPKWIIDIIYLILNINKLLERCYEQDRY